MLKAENIQLKSMVQNVSAESESIDTNKQAES